jgi:2-oxoacid:acceptor oxidoreductase gamma subunit (pyruvate/2-ketoisovalerate family)
MTEITIHGRGGQGGVTLAKLIATAYFRRGEYVQAFGVYAAERSGAPLQAFVRIDDREITNHNQIRQPDHVIVLDRTLIGPHVLAGAKPDGWVLLNTDSEPVELADGFAGRRVATVDATAIALANGLGTQAVPIVNTTMMGAVGKVLGLTWDEVAAALAEAKFGGANLAAAKAAFESVKCAHLPGAIAQRSAREPAARIVGILDEDVGEWPSIRTGSWATRQPRRHRLTPPCNHVCPAGNDVQGFVQALSDDDYDRALAILLETSPLPGCCGRVCPAPCMDACNRRLLNEAVNIRDLERSAAEHGHPPVPTQPWRPERVAVVGSGPAGLSAAYTLARLGFPVDLFEGQSELGGVLRTGIPTYRLPRDVLDAEISYILRHGVHALGNRRVGRQELLELTHSYAGTCLATGLQEVRGLRLGSDESGTVLDGIDFLDRVRQGGVSCEDLRVAVVGGGNTAIDAARSALRLGARSVRILYRRTRSEMPAIREEIDEGLAEGVVLDELVAPLQLRRDAVGPLLTCTRMQLGEPDESGRRRPVPEITEDAVFDLRCDQVILALGQSADISILPEGAEIRDGQALVGVTAAPVFLCGDLSTNEGTVAAAIGSGRRAAWHLHRTLTGEDCFPDDAAPVASPEHIHTHLFSRMAREPVAVVSPGIRRRSFAEVRRGLTGAPFGGRVADEAARCFSCGVCNSCDRCVVHCPEGIMVRDGDGYRFDESFCKGCGICAAECPRGVIYMAEL